jgi:hypothetical protein
MRPPKTTQQQPVTLCTGAAAVFSVATAPSVADGTPAIEANNATTNIDR